MSIFTKLGQQIAAPVDENGNPRSPENQDFQVWMTEAERLVDGIATNSALVVGNRAILFANLTPVWHSMAWVINDAVPGYNGIYEKAGNPGSGSWSRVADLPYSFILASNSGAGTANAIQASTVIPVNSSALVTLNIAATNTNSPVTVSFNGGAALTIKAFDGANIIAGGLAQGMVVAGFISGSTFRLISDQSRTALISAISAAVAAAETAQAGSEAAQSSAEDARDLAQQYAADAAVVSGVSVPIYNSIATATAATIPAGVKSIRTSFYAPNYAVPATLKGGANYKRTNSQPAHPLKFRSADRWLPDGSSHSTNGGWWEIDEPAVNVTQAGAVGDDVAEDTLALQRALDYGALTGVAITGGKFICRSKSLSIKDTETTSYVDGMPILRFRADDLTIKAISGSDADYLIAPERWISDVGYPQYPYEISDLHIDGNSIVKLGLVVCCYFGNFARIHAKNCILDGIHGATKSKNGTNLLGGVVENSFDEIDCHDNGRHGFYVGRDVQFTDYKLTRSICYNNGPFNAYLADADGAHITDNHFYHTVNGVCDGGVYFGDTFGTTIKGNVFEGDPSDVSKPCVVVAGNSPGTMLLNNNFWSPVRCEFSAGNNSIIFHANTFVAGGTILHSYLGGDRVIVSSGNIFATDNPYEFASNLCGPIFAQNDITIGGKRFDGVIRPNLIPEASEDAIKTLNAASSVTLANSDPVTVVLVQALTANMDIVLPNAPVWREFLIVRPSYATGAFTINIKNAGGSVVSQISAAGNWARVKRDAVPSWIPIGSGPV